MDDSQQAAAIAEWRAQPKAAVARNPNGYRYIVKRRARSKELRRAATITQREAPCSDEKLDRLQGSSGETPETAYLLAENSALVRRALLSLRTEQRQIIQLHYWLNVPLAQAARQMGMSRSSAYRLLDAGLHRMKCLLSTQQEEHDGSGSA